MQKTNIDADKVNLLESDIEDWIYENPRELVTSLGPVVEWIGRQYRLPSGVADLIGVVSNGAIAVIEIKNIPISKAAITQVCRYAADLVEILSRKENYPCGEDGKPIVWRVLVGPSIDAQTYAEAHACDVECISFAASLSLSLSCLGWSQEYRKHRNEQYSKLAQGVEWNRFGHTSDRRILYCPDDADGYSDIIFDCGPDAEAAEADNE